VNPSWSKSRFEEFITNSGFSVATLRAADATRLMLVFYREVRAADCPLDDNGDMVLFQWGAHDFGEGETFRYNITRQFILSGSDNDDGMSQLSLTVHFAVTDGLRAIQPGNHWCQSLEKADEFERFIRTHKATEAVLSLTPLRTTLSWSLI
jgi:hypothetical protein